MSPVALKRAFVAAQKASKLPKAVLVASLYGQSADMTPLLELCEHYGVAVIEDASESWWWHVGYDYRLSNILARIEGISLMPEASYGQASRWLTVMLLDSQQCGVSVINIFSTIHQGFYDIL